MARLYLALVHHPVVNRRGEVVASAVTNLDLHDIARAARTFGAKGFFVTTPLEDQQGFARRIVEHWTIGPGADHIPDRRLAMELVRITGSVDDAIAAVTAAEGRPPQVVATCANEHPQAIGCAALRRRLEGDRPHLLLFGTAWGLGTGGHRRGRRRAGPDRRNQWVQSPLGAQRGGDRPGPAAGSTCLRPAVRKTKGFLHPPLGGVPMRLN